MIERAAPSKCLEKCSNYDRQIRLCKKGHLDLCYLRNCRDFEKRKEKGIGTEQGEHRGIASREARKTGFMKLKTSEELLFAKALIFAEIAFTPNPIIEGLEVDFLIKPNLLIDIGYFDSGIEKRHDLYKKCGYIYVYVSNRDVRVRDLRNHLIRKIPLYLAGLKEPMVYRNIDGRIMSIE